MDEKIIKQEVKRHYASIASQVGGDCCGGSACCSGSSTELITLVDYADLNAALPEGANLGLGCGVPTTHAGFQPGETVLDLGSGAGVDVFLAARAVGPTGKAIGVDMTPEMIARARENAARGGYTNVEFRLGEIEELPVETASVDAIISNCVLNLVPDKTKAFAEMARVLKPGGRFIVSDMVTFGEMPDAVRSDLAQWAGCISGAIDRQAYLELLEQAGFTEVKVIQEVTYGSGDDLPYGMVSITVEGQKRDPDNE